MTSPIPESELREMEARAEKATIHPWRVSGDGVVQTKHITRDVWTIPRTHEDLQFIAAARSDVPRLVAEVRALTTALAAMTEDRDLWRSHAEDAGDCPVAARVAALEGALREARDDSEHLAKTGHPGMPLGLVERIDALLGGKNE